MSREYIENKKDTNYMALADYRYIFRC